MDAAPILTQTNTPSITKLSRQGRIKWANNIDQPWEEYWFNICANRVKTLDPVDAFWQRIGNSCLTSLCQISTIDEKVKEDFSNIASIALPAKATEWLEEAPPMPGGEFLNLPMLETLWGKLVQYCANECQQYGGIAKFIEDKAPGWSNVGRIFFHLAENKMDPQKPFAFLATYAFGLNDKGEPKHLPLANAVKKYAKSGDKPILLRLLVPLLRAAENIDWVREMLNNKTIYTPRPWTAAQAYRFLKSADNLNTCGVGVRLPNWWKKRSRPQIKATFNSKGDSLFWGQCLD